MSFGPRGGDLEVPHQNGKAEWRRSDLQTEVLSSGELSLHRFEKPDAAVPGAKNEQPWHRMAAYMLNAGRTNSEIAMSAGVTAQCVSNIRSQRWFQELCATIANKHGEELVGAIQSEALNSLNCIISIRDSDAPARVRFSAAQLILEQANGKATQKVVSDITHRAGRSPQEEMDEIQRELKALNQ